MKSRFIITNRQIINEVILPEDAQTPIAQSQEKIRRDGKEEAGLHTRYGRIDPMANLSGFEGDPNDLIQVYPHRENDDADFATPNGTSFGSQAMFADLHKAMCSDTGGDVLLYIHGYNCDLDKAVRNIGLIEEKYVREGSPIKHLVLFTWPARNNRLKYRNDIRDADESGEALARTILKLQRFFDTYFVGGANPVCGRKIHLMAHSTGPRVVKYAMSSLLSNTFGMHLQSIFGESVLVAADEDEDSLEKSKSLAFLCRISDRVHTYNHKKDLALGISQTTKNSHRRLGRTGVESLDDLPANLVMVDVTGCREDNNLIDDLINHWYYYTSPEVVHDIVEVFKGTPALDIAKAPTLGSKRHKWPEKTANLYYIGEPTEA